MSERREVREAPCGAVTDGFVCTRIYGHTGEHQRPRPKPEPQTPALERFTLSDNQRYLDTNRQMEADADGEWVPYESVASLLADRERLQTESTWNLKAANAAAERRGAERDAAKAEVERLTKQCADYGDRLLQAGKDIGAAERRAEALKEKAAKLSNYAVHHDDCDVDIWRRGGTGARGHIGAERPACNCGLAEALLTEPDPHV